MMHWLRILCVEDIAVNVRGYAETGHGALWRREDDYQGTDHTEWCMAWLRWRRADARMPRPGASWMPSANDCDMILMACRVRG